MNDGRRRFILEWYKSGKEDITLVEKLIADNESNGEFNFPRAICFHCQQAVEKYLKAFLVYCDFDFPKTHDIETLVELSARFDNSFTELDTEGLSELAVAPRYPDFEMLTENEIIEIYKKSILIIQFIKNRIGV